VFRTTDDDALLAAFRASSARSSSRNTGFGLEMTVAGVTSTAAAVTRVNPGPVHGGSVVHGHHSGCPIALVGRVGEPYWY
jgi:hypothetical protein